MKIKNTKGKENVNMQWTKKTLKYKNTFLLLGPATIIKGVEISVQAASLCLSFKDLKYFKYSSNMVLLSKSRQLESISFSLLSSSTPELSRWPFPIPLETVPDSELRLTSPTKLLLLETSNCNNKRHALKNVVKIIYGKPKKLLAELRNMSLSLRRFMTLPKIVQADYQPL